MFDIGWSEMAVIMLVALVVIGPKDLPRLARIVGQWVAKGRAMAREFQRSLEDMAREAELDDVKREIEKVGRTNIKKRSRRRIDPTGELGRAFDPTGHSPARPLPPLRTARRRSRRPRPPVTSEQPGSDRQRRDARGRASPSRRRAAKAEPSGQAEHGRAQRAPSRSRGKPRTKRQSRRPPPGPRQARFAGNRRGGDRSADRTEAGSGRAPLHAPSGWPPTRPSWKASSRIETIDGDPQGSR